MMKLLILALGLFQSCVLGSPITGLVLFGSPSSYVVGDRFLALLPSEGYTFTPTLGSHWNGTPGPDYVSVAVNAFPNVSAHWFYLDLGVPRGQTLQAGVYSGATRYPFQEPTAPGLSLYGDGRGSNRSIGVFSILEISYVGTVLQSLAVDFIQFDEYNYDAISAGVLRYNSSIPFDVGTAPVPEPSSLALGLSGLFLICGRNRLRNRTRP